MEIRVDQSMRTLGIDSVIIGIAKNLNPLLPLSKKVLEKIRLVESKVLEGEMENLKNHPYTKGYEEMLQRVGRSIKKNPPTVPAFVKNIQRRGHFPHVNTIVDCYNVESLLSGLAIGGHDLSKIQFPLEFTISEKEDVFKPILSTEKHVAESDFVYRDQKGVVAWIGVRDGEDYKFDDQTTQAIFTIQGNANTSIEKRIEALEQVKINLVSCMPDVEFEMLVIPISENE